MIYRQLGFAHHAVGKCLPRRQAQQAEFDAVICQLKYESAVLILILFMVKSFRPRESIGTLWRDGRAAEGACLENMFGSHQRGFESHSLRLGLHDRMSKCLKVCLALVAHLAT